LNVVQEDRELHMTSPRRCALVTGASAGIGASFARYLAAQGHDLVLVARRAERLQELARALEQAHGTRCDVVTADLGAPDAPQAVYDAVARLGRQVDVLVNNAGLSGRGKFAETPWADLSNELQVMVGAVTQLTHLFVPGMKQRGWGRVINLSSLAAFSPPGASLLYTGIKGYVLHMSEALNMELKPHGVHVSALCPGFTHSEFHDVMGTRRAANKLPRMLWQQPEDVVREGYAAVMKGKPFCVPGTVNKLVAASLRPVPEMARYHLGRWLNPFK
jgi:short-subunit dehydrogenase